jgi:hypothetical protein
LDKKKKASVFETLPIVDNTHVDPETGAANPSDDCVRQAKEWVDDGSQL